MLPVRKQRTCCPDPQSVLSWIIFLRASVAGDGATSTQAPFHVCGVHGKLMQFLLMPGSAVRSMVVITGLKGQLALEKQTEALPSLPVGNFGLCCRTDAWETHFKSSAGSPAASGDLPRPLSGQSEGQEALL